MPPTKSATTRLLITGSTGYIGGTLLRTICQHHFPEISPVAIMRPGSDTSRLQRFFPPRLYLLDVCKVFMLDYDDLHALKNVMRDVDIVVHLAADMDFFPTDEDALIARNIALTTNLLETAAEEARRPTRRKNSRVRFVYVSSTEAIGPTDGTSPASDTAPLKPTSAYARSKALCEQLVQEYSPTLQAVIARPTGTFGPNERFFFYELMQMCSTGLSIVAPSPMSGRVSFTHIDDVVAGILLCATHKDASGEYNICSDGSETYRAVIEKLADGLGYSRPVISLPTWMGELVMCMIGPLMNWGKHRTFVYQAKTVRETVLHREYNNARLKTLGFRPKYGMLDGMEQTLKYELRSGGIRQRWLPRTIGQWAREMSRE